MLVAPRWEAKRAEEARLVNWREHRHYGLLDYLVLERRDAKETLLARLSDIHLAREIAR